MDQKTKHTRVWNHEPGGLSEHTRETVSAKRVAITILCSREHIGEGEQYA